MHTWVCFSLPFYRTSTGVRTCSCLHSRIKLMYMYFSLSLSLSLSLSCSQIGETAVKGPPVIIAHKMTMASSTVIVTPMTLKGWTVPVPRRNKSVGRSQWLVTRLSFPVDDFHLLLLTGVQLAMVVTSLYSLYIVQMPGSSDCRFWTSCIFYNVYKYVYM